jgi:hypothetical protein
MNKIRRTGPPRAIDVWDGRYSFVVRLNEPPAAPWIYSFKLATPVASQYDPERVVVAPERGLLFESEEALVPGWIDHIDLWIASVNTEVAAAEAAEGKPSAEARTEELLVSVNEKFKDL